MHSAGHKHWGSSMTGGPRTTEQGRLHVRGKLGRAYCFPPVWVDQFHGFGPGHRLVPQNMLLQPPSREIFCEESCTPVLLVPAQCRTSTRSLAHFNFLRRRGRGGEAGFKVGTRSMATRTKNKLAEFSRFPSCHPIRLPHSNGSSSLSLAAAVLRNFQLLVLRRKPRHDSAKHRCGLCYYSDNMSNHCDCAGLGEEHSSEVRLLAAASSGACLVKPS